VSFDRKTGIFLPETIRRETKDYSDFLTGDHAEDCKRIGILLETLAEVNSSISVSAVIVSVLDKSIEVTGAERAVIMLYDDEKVLRIEMARDQNGVDLGRNVKYSHSVAMRVAREGKGICLIDAANQDEISLGQSILDLKLLTVMCVPLRVKDRMIGLLYVDSKATAGEFEDRDLTLFTALAGQVAVAVDNSRLLEHYVEKQRITEELAVARTIQQSLLPRGGMTATGLEIHGLSVPCDETSGDYFDYIRRPNDRLGLVVGDVSGHGVPAAIVMSTARAFLRSLTATDATPAQVVTRLNRFLADDVETGKFMTLFYAELDVDTREFTYVRAGHNEPHIYRRETDSFEELAEGGIALAFIDDFEFDQAGPIALNTGDLLFMYTDGIVEAMDAAGEQFGMERVHRILRARRDEPARDIVDALRQAAQAHIGTDERQDDLTLVLAKAT
jgi:sigma-B regulation protein RsbU (phosphoserine phosphatase)